MFGRQSDQKRSNQARMVAYGPFRYLEEGRYLISMEIEILADEPDRPKDEPCLFVEVVAGSELLGIHLLRRRELVTSNHKFTFVVCREAAEGVAGTETRIGVLDQCIAIQALTVEPIAAPIVADDKVAAALTIADLLRIDNWLPFLRLGPLGRSDGWGVAVESGEPAFAVYGPYWSLPAGKYEMTARTRE